MAADDMGKLLLFVFSTAMFVVGLYLVVAELLWTHMFYIDSIFIVIAGAFLAFVGARLLWATFVTPLLVGRTRKDK